MKYSSALRYRKWENSLVHINIRKQGLPEELVAWTGEYFGKSPYVQRLLGLNNVLKPEIETALTVLNRLKEKGVFTRPTRRKAQS